MFLTKRQEEILEAQKPIARSQQIPHLRLGITPNSVNSTNTYIFDSFMEALKVMSDPDIYKIFERRFRKNHSEIWDLTRQIRGMTKKAIE